MKGLIILLFVSLTKVIYCQNYKIYPSQTQKWPEPVKVAYRAVDSLWAKGDFDQAIKGLREIIDDSNINEGLGSPLYAFDEKNQKYFLYKNFRLHKLAGKYDIAIEQLKRVIKLGGSTSYIHRDKFDLAILYIDNGQLGLACEELQAISLRRRVYNYEDRFKRAKILKDSLCLDLLAQKEFEKKKAQNPHYGNQAPAFSLLGGYKDDTEKALGKSTGKILQHRGGDSYDAFVHKNKWGEYRVAYRNSRVILVWFYPSVKQKFDTGQLWHGGMFDIDNDHLLGDGICQSSNGFYDGVDYYSIDCQYGYNWHSIVFYGKKDGYVSKVLVF